MSELDKLEKYLLDHRITYERYEVHEEWDGPAGLTFEMDRHQICVPEEDEARTCGNCNHSTMTERMRAKLEM